MAEPALPTRREEGWRYADLDALARLWPLAPAENVVVPAAGTFARTIEQETDGIARLTLSLGENARAVLHVLNLAPGYGRIEIDATLHASADLSLHAVQLGGGDATLEIVTRMRHAEPNATSRQIVRSVAGGRATVSFLGQVAVARHAIGTDAVQSVRAMLLSPTATANAKPELEIYADDVKCAHGCAVGELDAQALFYLAQRGLPPALAKALLLQAFVAEALPPELVERAEARLKALA